MTLFLRTVGIVLLVLLCPLAAAESPKLIVIMAIDQMRPDRLNASMPGGLGRLMREGHVFSEATLDHGLTNTCPGHVVMSTGVNPNKAGIPGNSYVDHQTMQDRYCVDDEDSAFQVYNAPLIRSPNALKATTIGTWLKNKSPDSKVFSVSGKDRAAITLAGKNADGVYWYHTDALGFTTSMYYGELPNVVAEFNNGDFFTTGFGGSFPESWVHGEGSKRVDDYVGESEMFQRKSAHPLNVGEPSERAKQIYFSPYIDIATGALAKKVIEEEQLGQRGVTDMLAVSFSATDVVGHMYGPFSAESEDAIAILDAEVGLLLDALDEATGGDYVLAMSADHGVMPLPEWLVETGEMQCATEGGRIDLEREGMKLYWHLYWKFTFPLGKPSNLIGISSAGITVNARYAEELGVTVDEVVSYLEEYYEGKNEIAAAWTNQELISSDDPFARLYRNSFVAGKSAHLVPQFEETCLAFRPQGTSHGSPYLYDRRVPMVFFGKGVMQGVSTSERHNIDIAPTLGARLGLTMPDNLDGIALPIWDDSAE